MHFFREELAGDKIGATSLIGATVAMLDWEFRVSVTVSRTAPEGEGLARRSEPLPLTES